MSFKQFLFEGGKATAKFHTKRATKPDIEVAIEFVSSTLGIDKQSIIDNLVGSTVLTYNGDREDSGDIDIVFETEHKDEYVKKMSEATNEPYVIANVTYSFPVPVSDTKMVQVDFTFSDNIEWAKFSYHADKNSKYKSGVRNEFLHSVVKYTPKDGEDLKVKDENGNLIVKAARSFRLDKGFERVFKIAPERKDGKGRVKSMQSVEPDAIDAELKKLDKEGSYSKDADLITDPDKFASMLFGEGVKAKDIMTAEQVIALIKKRPDAVKVFADAKKGLEKRKLEIPEGI